jgi:hypothetical protein
MPDESTQQPKVEAIVKAVAELRFLVADLQGIISERPLPDAESANNIKSRLLSMDGRLARLETNLSALAPMLDWIQQDLQNLLTDVSAAVEDMLAIRLEVYSLLDGTNTRIM